MIEIMPVYQTIFDREHGNCMQACVASLFCVPLEAIPNFMADGPEHYDELICKWCDEHNMITIDVQHVEGWYQVQDIPVIAWGPADRGVAHAVIIRNGKLIHDPYPDGNGLREISGITLFIIKNHVGIINPC